VANLYLKAKRGIIIFLHKTLPACIDMTQLMSQSLDRRLGLGERITLRLHLWICLNCARYLRQIDLLRNLSRPASRAQVFEDSQPALSNEATERIKNAFKQGSL
jgi:hypothetical protein